MVPTYFNYLNYRNLHNYTIGNTANKMPITYDHMKEMSFKEDHILCIFTKGITYSPMRSYEYWWASNSVRESTPFTQKKKNKRKMCMLVVILHCFNHIASFQISVFKVIHIHFSYVIFWWNSVQNRIRCRKIFYEKICS